VVAAATIGFVGAPSGASVTSASIITRGSDSTVNGSHTFPSVRFSPPHTTVRSGGTITLMFGNAGQDPHTLSIVAAAELPTSDADIANCEAPGTVCDQIFSTVAPSIVNPAAAQFVNVSGGPGLDGHFDTMYLPPGTNLTVPVTAAPGTTLHYICAIHAWMQGDITVLG
jgi:hypothetical protein